jgi:tetratricopeptide (TPR) repeat protein
MILATTPSLANTPVPGSTEEQEFRQKLNQAIEKTDQSAKLLRQQIAQSTNAPFLPDLYVQLGDLMSQKALTLYYIQMERDSKLESGEKPKVEDSKDVVNATKEAIQTYQLVLREFPKYPKRSEVSYKLALSLKSIEETAKFIAVASRIQEEFPGTEEAMRAGLLLGRHYLDAREYEDALKYLQPISESKYTYEKNLAKYWIGLCSLGKEKYKEALKLFEAVIEDPELKVQENPYEIKKGSKKVSKNDLKREALIDSLRAYTFVFEKDPNPVEYYSRLSPTEVHFQEVMEKLAIRYVLLKKYAQSVKVLRTMSERTADPQRVINVYREILLLIPMEQRLAIPVEEMRFVIQKFTLWRSYMNVPAKVHSDAYWFFEKQIRDIGTRNHDNGKVAKDPLKKREFLERGRDYYFLYEDYFAGSPNSVKMAMNIADVYFLLGKYFESGETYLRLYDGAYGKTNQRKAFIENSILSLQKDKEDAFYAKVRSKGVLLRAITEYQKLVPAKKQDIELEFLRLKTQYDQGFMPIAIEELFVFMRKHKDTKKGKDAGELILDYFNTLNDFTGLEYWSDKILGLKIQDAAFVSKVRAIKKQAKNRVFEEKVKTAVGYDAFSQGKSYLAAAMNSGDESVKNAVLQEALAKSKAEKDIQTFFEAARLMAKKESNPQKRVSIYRSIAQENMKVGRFYTGIEQLRSTANESGSEGGVVGLRWGSAGSEC